MAAFVQHGGQALFSSLAERARGRLRNPPTGAPLSEDKLSGFCGRVCRGVDGEEASGHWERLNTLEPCFHKPVSCLVGADGLAMLLGEGSAVERLCALGFERKWIAAKLASGQTFRLALFPAEQATAADWDGVFALVRHAFPHVAPVVARVEQELRRVPFDQLHARARASYLGGAEFYEVNEQPAAMRLADARYVTTERLAARAEAGAVGAEVVRGWLYFVVGLSDLYSGTGWTHAPDGQRGVREYLIEDRRVSEFGDRFVWLPIEIAEAHAAPIVQQRVLAGCEIGRK
jgi:hypothetical protein